MLSDGVFKLNISDLDTSYSTGRKCIFMPMEESDLCNFPKTRSNCSASSMLCSIIFLWDVNAQQYVQLIK